MTREEFDRFNLSLHNIREILAETAALTHGTAEGLRRLEEAQQRTEEAQLKTEEAQRETEAALRRAIRLAVREARAERVRRRAADEDFKKMIERQDVAWQRFLDSRSHHEGDSN